MYIYRRTERYGDRLRNGNNEVKERVERLKVRDKIHLDH